MIYDEDVIRTSSVDWTLCDVGTMKSIHPLLFVICVFLFLLMTKIASLLLPQTYYFSFSAFLFDNRELEKLPALAAKLAQPFFLAFCVIFVLARLSRSSRQLFGSTGNLSEIISDQASITLSFAAALSALLLAWPYILLWDILIDPVLAPYRALYLLSYIAYVVGFSFFALSGAETARVFLSLKDHSKFSLAALKSSDFLRPIYNALSGAVATAVAAFFSNQVV